MLHGWGGGVCGVRFGSFLAGCLEGFSKRGGVSVNWFHSSVPVPIGIGGIRKQVNPHRGSGHTFQVGTGTETGSPGFPKLMFSSPKRSLQNVQLSSGAKSRKKLLVLAV